MTSIRTGLIHHVCKSMSAQQRNQYRRLVEKGTHIKDGNRHRNKLARKMVLIKT